jgi:hypothetical protein
VTLSNICIRPRLSAGADIVIGAAVMRTPKEGTGRWQEAKSLPSFRRTAPRESCTWPERRQFSPSVATFAVLVERREAMKCDA